MPLEIDGQSGQDSQEGQGLHTHLLALIHLRLSSPAEEDGDILGHLRGCCGGAILIFNQAIVQDTGHTNGTTREVRVEVESLTDFNTRWGILVASQERIDIVLKIIATAITRGNSIRSIATSLSLTTWMVQNQNRGKLHLRHRHDEP